MALIKSSKFLSSPSSKSLWHLRNCCNAIKKGSESEADQKNKTKPSLGLEKLKDVNEEENMKKYLPTTIPLEGPMDTTLINGIPQEHLECRRVRIFKPSKNPMQSGTANINHWELAFDTKQRWENPLMGWCSSGDPLSNLRLKFPSKEAAIEYCEKNSWQWNEEKSFTKRKFKARPYVENFSNKRCRVSTK